MKQDVFSDIKILRSKMTMVLFSTSHVNHTFVLNRNELVPFERVNYTDNIIIVFDFDKHSIGKHMRENLV